ncbi:MAG: acyl-[acyl-carrier-protein] thioesterase [Lachnospiraceae bacterium]|jgi:medium-chain acyl-[acyl-carrier-protein] hydrolase|nr:acyl-[acyl-carrier-protein] thioesterase [Lachnospiraceae bacterium]
MYSFNSKVRYSEVGEDKKLSLYGIVNYFQDCSTFQSEELNVGVGVLEAMHRVWVLSAWQIVVKRYPSLCEEIQTSTWPYQFQGFCGYRNFTMTDKNGELLAYANTLWSFLDTDTGRPARVPKEIEKVYILEEKLDMEYASRKVPMPGEGEEKEPFAVQPQHLDTNHHVNNGQYIQMAQKYMPLDFVIRQMRAEYKKSAHLGDLIYPVMSQKDGIYTIGLCDEEKHPYAVVELSGV